MDRPSPQSQPAPAGRAPSVLVVGDDPITGELLPALRELGIDASSARTAEGVHAVVHEAPDLVVLAGSTRRSASALLEPLTDHPSSAAVPVVLLGDTSEVNPRTTASHFSSGVVGRMGRDLGVDLIALEVQRIIDELPARPDEARGVVAEATLDELVDLLSNELQSGILSVDGQRQAHIVLRAGRPVGEGIDEFMERVKPMFDERGEAAYAFHAHPSGRIDSLMPPSADALARSPSMRPGAPPMRDLQDRRLLVLHRERDIADHWAAALRRRGAQVTCLCEEGDLDDARAFDAEVLIVEPSALEGRKHALIRAVQRDERLRWAATLIAPHDALEHPDQDALYLDELAAKVESLTTAHDGLLRKADLGDAFETRIELVGPAHLLRALCSTGRASALKVHHPNALIEVTTSGGRVLEARAIRRDWGTERLADQDALSLLLSLKRGRAEVEPTSGYVRPAEAPKPLSLHPQRFVRPTPLPSIAPGPLVSSIPPPPLLPSGADKGGLAGTGDWPMLGLTLAAMALALVSLVVYVVWL